MHSPPQPPTPAIPAPFPFLGVSALIFVYALLSYLLVNFFDQIDDLDDTMLSAECSSSGLSAAETQALPWFEYGEEGIASCAICLDCFQHGEKCRSFPVCNHTFHAHCIDLWLSRSITCPTCRSPFVRQRGFQLV